MVIASVLLVMIGPYYSKGLKLGLIVNRLFL